jgi:nucleoside-diphosphate-sugar epimerase
MAQNALHVIFGTGPLGLAVMRELRRRGLPVRLVNRSGKVTFEKDAQTQVGGGDAADPKLAREVCEGAAVVYHCVGLPYTRWREFPDIARGIAEGAAHAGATLVYGDNVYAWGHVKGPIHEGLPEAPNTVKGRIRAEVAGLLRDAHAAGKVRVAIGRGSDFFGPGVTEASMLGSRVFGRLLAGKASQVVGNPDRLHSYTFIEDFALALIILGERFEAASGTWIVPTAPALSTRDTVALIARLAGARPLLSVAPRWLLGLAGMFDQQMHELREMLYEFEEDFVLDSSRFRHTFGLDSTPLEDALLRTVEWYRKP